MTVKMYTMSMWTVSKGHDMALVFLFRKEHKLHVCLGPSHFLNELSKYVNI